MLANLKTQGDLHLPRKLFHVTSISAIFLCMVLFPYWVNWCLYLLLGLPLMLLDYGRRFSPAVNKALMKVMAPYMRKHETESLSGVTYTIMSVGIIYFLFDDLVAEIATLMLAFGDPTASYFGLRFGKRNLMRNKSLIGIVAGALACFIVCFGFLSLAYPEQEFILRTSLICGLIGAIAEITPIGKIDDNFTQPIISACLLTAVKFFILPGGFL